MRTATSLPATTRNLCAPRWLRTRERRASEVERRIPTPFVHMHKCNRVSMPRRLNAVLHFAMLLCLCGCRLPQSGIAPSDSSERGPAFEDIHKIDVHAHIFEEMPKLIE